MKKLLLLFMILGLGFSACKKQEGVNENVPKNDTFVLNGETFNVEDVRTKFALMGGLDKNELTWVPDSLGFRRVNYADDDIYKVVDFINEIKRMSL